MQTKPCAKSARGVVLVLHRRMAKFCLVYHASLFLAVSDLHFKPFHAVLNL